ncbi:hypothetical protein [Saccharothrix luteola]|uniref:hypothetical protein n=1 Tax=Saccharothrix luteola TaxID=2893018 RepID=UPI001E2BA44C|nr:hypothetical protein [Saccharothrix luteola]MCC8242876.1 hypothetical protein [Saccharothrix luteola]
MKGELHSSKGGRRTAETAAVEIETVDDLVSPVSTHNEWDPLEEIIVGTPYHLDYHGDRSFRIFSRLTPSGRPRWGTRR